MNFTFNPVNFINNLPIMGKGMLGIFIVILIIVAITAILNRVTAPTK